MKLDKAKTVATAQDVTKKLGVVTSEIIDKMDENELDEHNAPLILGMMVGVRAFIAIWNGLEGALIPALEHLDIKPSDWFAGTEMADEAGRLTAQAAAAAAGFTNERVYFRLIVMQCCGQQLCWVNPRLPNHCPECGEHCFPDVRGWVSAVDTNAILRLALSR